MSIMRRMENVRRLGGEAGVLAGAAAAWAFLGATLIFPSAKLNLIDQMNPHKYLPFIAKHETMFWMVNILGGLLAPLLALILLLALADRFQDEAPASSRIGSLFGIVGMAALGIGALTRQVGLGALSALYIYHAPKAAPTATKTAATAFFALNAMVNSIVAMGGVATGLGVLILGSVMLRAERYRSIGYLGAITGIALVLSAFIAHVFLFMASSILTVAWLIWTGLTLRAEVTPAYAGHRSIESRRVTAS